MHRVLHKSFNQAMRWELISGIPVVDTDPLRAAIREENVDT